MTAVTTRSPDGAALAAPMGDRLVVGVVGSSADRPAREWADAEAALRGVPLQIVSLTTSGCNQLLEAAADVELVVVGPTRRRRHGPVPTVGARRGRCPVIVVRGDARQPLRRIVVGVDGSNASSAAMEWACDEAVRHDAELVAVHAWLPAVEVGRSTRGRDLDRSDARRVLDLAVQRGESRMSGDVRGELIEGDAASVLTTASNDADLVVVGSRGHSGFRTLRFGSVAVFVVAHAGCPVAVIHPRVRA